MLFTTSSQLIVLVLLFFAGLLLGMGLRSGGKKWRKRFADESGNYAQFRRDADVRLREANRRIAELDQENAALRHARPAEATTPIIAEPGASGVPVAASAAVPAAASAAVPAAASAAVPAFAPEPSPEPQPDPSNKSWFSIGQPDLGHIRGIDAVLKTRLAALSVTRFEDITGMSAEDEMALEQRLSLPAGYITREQWREQAALLQDGKDAEHAERFPAR